MLNFDQFLNSKTNSNSSTKIAAGVAIIYENKILLVHPKNSSWKKGTCGIPKGGVEPEEDTMDAALRELKEETGIVLDPKLLDPHPREVSSSGGKLLIYYLCVIDRLDQINLESERLPKSQLQAEEIDWAKFVSPEEAYPITSRSQLIILDRHLTLER